MSTDITIELDFVNYTTENVYIIKDMNQAV